MFREISKLIVISLVLATCDGHLATKRLYEDLLSDYNRLIRPVFNINHTIFVNLSLKLTQILDINMKQQIMLTNVWLEQNWFDFQLQWNPKDYDGVNMIYIPAEDIWQPDIVLFNNADGIYEVASMTKALVYHTGEVYWRPPALFKSTCEIDVQYFPFDMQICAMKFASWTYDGNEVDLRSVDKSQSLKLNVTKEAEAAKLIYEQMSRNLTLNQTENVNRLGYRRQIKLEHNLKQSSTFEIINIGIDMSEFCPSVEWDVLAIPAYYKREYFSGLKNPYPEITFKIKLRRKTLFYTVNLIIPIIGNAFMTLLVFFLPSDSGQKIALSTSLLVSLTVFFLLLAEIVPPSKTVPLLGKYLLFTMILIACSICCTVFILNIHYRSLSTHIMQPWIRRLFIEILPKYLLMHRPTIKDSIKELKALSKSNKFEFKSCKELDNTSEDALRFFSTPAKSNYYRNQGIQSIESSFDEEQPNKSNFFFNSNANPDQSELLYDTDLGMSSIIFQQTQPENLNPTNETPKQCSIPRNSLSIAKQKNNEMTGYGEEVNRAIQSILSIAEHLKNQNEEKNAIEDWKYVGMILDRFFLILFTFVCSLGSIIILQAPSFYDYSPAIESSSSKSLVTSNGI